MHFLRKLLVSACVMSTVVAAAPVLRPGDSARAAAASAGIPVMGPSVLSAPQLANWYRSTGHGPALPVTIEQMAQYYIDEGRAEGVRGDLAFAQSIVETGYFGFVGSIVKPWNFNYAGMGACDSCNSGRQFPSAQIGVRAQIQHLRNFADPTSRAAGLANPPVVEWYGLRSNGVLDPGLAIYNFDTFFAKGTAPTWNQMGGPGKWATAPTYATVILQIYNRMLVYNGQAGSCPADRLAVGWGQAWECPLPIRQPGRAVSAVNSGYYVLNGNGAVNAVGAPWYGNPSFAFDIARDIKVTPDGLGYVVLDGYGGIHLMGSAATGPLRWIVGPYFGFDIARSLALTPDGAGYLVLDGYGAVHAAGTAHVPPGGYPYWLGWDIARSIAITQGGNGLALLDGFGVVWTMGTQPFLGTTDFGFDIARDLVATPTGDGYAVLDGFGAVHGFGTAPAAPNIGYATYDRWRGVALRNGGYTAVRNDGYSVG